MASLQGFELPSFTEEDLSDKKQAKKIMEYLYQLTEQLRYTLANLDEENFTKEFSESVGGGENITALTQKITDAQNMIASTRKQTAAGFEQTVQKDGIISAINQSLEEVAILANKINLNGVVTANNAFKINTDGSMEASYGKIGMFQFNAQTSFYSPFIAFMQTDAQIGHLLLGGNDMPDGKTAVVELTYTNNGGVLTTRSGVLTLLGANGVVLGNAGVPTTIYGSAVNVGNGVTPVYINGSAVYINGQQYTPGGSTGGGMNVTLYTYGSNIIMRDRPTIAGNIVITIPSTGTSVICSGSVGVYYGSGTETWNYCTYGSYSGWIRSDLLIA